LLLLLLLFLELLEMLLLQDELLESTAQVSGLLCTA